MRNLDDGLQTVSASVPTDNAPRNDVPYETRELAWELGQDRPDQRRIRLFLEQSADLRQAMDLAHVNEHDLVTKPAFKPLKLQKYLGNTPGF